MKLEAIHDILTNKKSYAQKALELMLTDPKIVGDWMENIMKTAKKQLKIHILEKLINITMIKF